MSYRVLFLHLLISFEELTDLYISWFTDLNGTGRLYPTQSVLKALREVAEVSEITVSFGLKNQLGQEVFGGNESGDDVFSISGRSNVTELGVRRLPLVIAN